MVGKERYSKEELTKISNYQAELRNASKWLAISKSDLDSSEILFNSKKYPNSVREFQQSVEKTTKALALINDSLKSSELKKTIGHNPLKKYYSKNVSQNLEKVKNLEKAFEKIPALKEVPMMKNLKLKEFKDNSEKANEILLQVSEGKIVLSDNLGDLDYIIKDAQKVLDEVEESKKQEFRKEDYELMKKEWIENVRSISKISREEGNSPISEGDEEQILKVSGDVIKDLAKRHFKNVLLGSITGALDAMLNLVITPHFEFFRYPDKKDPLEYYVEKNPLIKRLDQLIEIQKRNIIFHEEFLEFALSLQPKIVIED
ncbi:MAG: HEPN domain-containing protein [Sphaerochaetaceae bacterium]|nr:HEPN domain-containing protein [Sphaerochaetaceae bacterium]